MSRRHASPAAAEHLPRSGAQGHPGLLPDDTPGAAVRLDKWLWAARFFKTRSLATEAVEAGRVRFHGDRPKPSRPVRVGDTLEVRCEGGIFQVAVIGLADRRGPASLAQALYREDPDSRSVREELAARRRAEALIRPWKGRPTKRERRALVKFTRVSGGQEES